MINVIILTENKKYQVLDVPVSGKLYINEPHLISAITQNGVLMVPYGDVLTPFEVYALDSCMSVSMVTTNLMHQGGRLLDFTVIELLQASQTLSPSASGSSNPYANEAYYSDGYPVNYNLKLKGLDFSSKIDADNYFKTKDANALVNSLGNSSDGFQLLSVVGTTFNGIIRLFENTNVSHIYDLGVGIQNLNAYALNNCPLLEVVDLPYLEEWRTTSVIYTTNKNVKLKTLNMPSLLSFAGDATTGGAFFNSGLALKIGSGATVSVPRAMETANAGQPHASIKQLIDNDPTSTINYID